MEFTPTAMPTICAERVEAAMPEPPLIVPLPKKGAAEAVYWPAWPHIRQLRPYGHDPHHASAAGGKTISVNPTFRDGF